MKRLKNWTSTAVVVAGFVALIWDIIWTATDDGWWPWVAYFTCLVLILGNLKGMLQEIRAWKARR